MRYLKLNKISACLAGLLLFCGCSSEMPDAGSSPAPGEAAGDAPVYLSFKLSRAFGEEGDKATRADDDKVGNEAKISSLVALLVDTDQDQTIKGIGVAGKGTVGTPTGGKYKVTVSMGLAASYSRQHKYRLYVFANLADYSEIFAHQDKPIADLGKATLENASYLASELNATSFTGLPYSTTAEDAAKVQVYLQENTDYPSSSPYLVQADTGKTDPTQENEATLSLTPIHACLSFAKQEGITDFTYAIGDATNPEVKVQFKKAQVINAATKAYLMPQGQASDFSLSSPASPGYANSSAFDVKEGKALYLPEHISKPADGALTFGGTTYMQLTGVLTADADCKAAADVKNAIQAASEKKEDSPTLYYYSDGTYQSALTTSPDHAGETNWHAITYNADLGGYAVTYRHAIRHDAGEGKNLDDGIAQPMEYAVVRNYLYTISIASVTSLPHSFNESDPVEDTKQDISIQIKPAQWIQYHRGAFEIEL